MSSGLVSKDRRIVFTLAARSRVKTYRRKLNSAHQTKDPNIPYKYILIGIEYRVNKEFCTLIVNIKSIPSVDLSPVFIS